MIVRPVTQGSVDTDCGIQENYVCSKEVKEDEENLK